MTSHYARRSSVVARLAVAVLAAATALGVLAWPTPPSSSTTIDGPSHPRRRFVEAANAPADTFGANPVYSLAVAPDCPSQSVPPTRAAYRDQVRSLVDCLNDAWRPALRSGGIAFSAPRVAFCDDKVAGQCGAGAGAPAFYCPLNQTMYFSARAWSEAGYFRLSAALTVFHEYSHHVQALAHILGRVWLRTEPPAVTSRRIELQAHCLAHFQLAASDIGLDVTDDADLEYQFGWTDDPDGHGSTDAERYWGRRGLKAHDAGACNTWTVKAARVK